VTVKIFNKCCFSISFTILIHIISAIENSNIELNSIHQVICCTFSGDYIYPALSCKIAKILKLKEPGCFDVMANCTGFQTGLNIAFNNLKSSKNINLHCNRSTELIVFGCLARMMMMSLSLLTGRA
jgi:hypothetical protein